MPKDQSNRRTSTGGSNDRGGKNGRSDMSVSEALRIAKPRPVVAAAAHAGAGRPLAKPVGVHRPVVTRPPPVTRAPVRGDWGRNTVLTREDIPGLIQAARRNQGNVPREEIEPVIFGEPLRDGDYLLWHLPEQGRVYYALSVPRLLDAVVTIRRESVANTIRITGGSMTLTLTARERLGPQSSQLLQDSWAQALQLGPTPTTFLPMTMRGLKATYEGDSQLVGSVAVVVSASVGVVTYTLALTELGAQTWKDALEQRRGDLLPGVCRMTGRCYGNAGVLPSVEPLTLSAPLGELLAGRGPEVLQIVNGQMTVDARVIVSGHQTLETVVVDWRPSEGHTPETLIFGAEGGSFNGPITSQNPGQVSIDWSAQVNFLPPNWPIVRQQGRLSCGSNEWTLMLKPSAWVNEYTLIVVLLDAAGNPVPSGADIHDLEHRVQCQACFSAPFLSGGSTIVSSFETSSFLMTVLSFPQPPDAAPGELKLTIFAQRGATTRMATRVVSPSESMLVVTVDIDAAIDLAVNAPESGETLQGALLDLVAQLA